ncbi:MAG: cell division protein CrgA [Propionibacteriales bacterium]|nr:cell division protein CrgA [Propionibacteriales bacterium]
MPESRSRKKKRLTSKSGGGSQSSGEVKPRKVGGGRWVAPVMVFLLVAGLVWIVVYYIGGQDVPYMSDLGDWNLLIGMGAIMLGLLTAMKWE